MKHVFNGGYLHSHQLNFKLDWSGIKLWLAQVVLTFLWEGEKKIEIKNVVARGGDGYIAVFDWQSSMVGCWNGTDPAAEWALHQEVFVSGVELRRPDGLEIGLEKPLAECSHWEDTWKLSWTLRILIMKLLIKSICDQYCCEPEANTPSVRLMGLE